MLKFSEADKMHLQAAEGWFELGDHLECNEELQQITPELRAHPDVLKVSWAVYAAAEKWTWALTVAVTITEMVPEKPHGWIFKSHCLRYLNRTQEARDNLLAVAETFPNEAMMRYNLACYECQLGRLEQAEEWLHKAFDIGDQKRLKLMALDDPDLKPLRSDVAQI